jgi:hypothetical protein
MYMFSDMCMRRGVRVARQTFVTLIDDLDGGPADETVRFGIGGVRYEIDLSRKNAARLRRELAPFIERGRPAGTRRTRGGRPRRTAESRQRSQDIRAWAREQGLSLRARGRIPASVAEQYQAAVGDTARVLPAWPRGPACRWRTGRGELALMTNAASRIVARAHRNPPRPDVYSGHAPLPRSQAVRSRCSLRALRDRCRDIRDTPVGPGPDAAPGQLRLHRGRRDHVRQPADAAASAAQLASFVTQVLAETGAAKVDLVGHSQGGMMPRYYLKFLGGAQYVNTFVALAPSNHGTTLDGLTTLVDLLGAAGLVGSALNPLCPACAEQEAGSSFLASLNAGGETVPGVNYTVIESRDDEVVTPYTSAFLTGPDVTNITVQNQCPLDQSDHLEIAADPIAMADMLNALDPAHPVRVPCLVVLPVTGPVGPVPAF